MTRSILASNLCVDQFLNETVGPSRTDETTMTDFQDDFGDKPEVDDVAFAVLSSNCAKCVLYLTRGDTHSTSIFVIKFLSC